MIATQEAVLSLLLLYPAKAPEIAEKVQPQWFSGIRRTALDLLLDGSCDSVALASAGIPATEIARWLELDAGMWSLDRHSQNLQQYHVAGLLEQLSADILRAENNETAIRQIEDFMLRLTDNSGTEPVSSRDGAARLAKDLESRSTRRGLLGMTYGLPDLDNKTEGLQLGDLVIVAAPSSMGKTAFAAGVIEAAAESGNPALVFSCEMTVEQLLMRTLSAKSGIPLKRIRSARFQDRDWPQMTHSFERISQMPLWIDDSSGISMQQVVRKVKQMKRRHGIKLVMIDYLQIMSYDRDQETRELDRITTGLKDLAKREGVCVVLLSQLNRMGQAQNRKPVMTDLRGSGMIENNADVILFPWRPAANCEKCQNNEVTPDHDPETHKREAYIIIGKQRQGERNIAVPVIWLEEITRFESFTAIPDGF